MSLTDDDPGTATLCGLRGCTNPRSIGAFIEGLADFGGTLHNVRVEVCADHYASVTRGFTDHLSIAEEDQP